MSEKHAVGDKLNAAALMLTSQRFDDGISAYRAIGVQHPEELGTCLGQIGACYFFKGEYSEAIKSYVRAKEKGADPAMMDDKIQEAQEALAQANRGVALPSPGTAPIRSSGLLLAVPVAIGILVLMAAMCVGGAAYMAV
jgi:tetratricopeptide (TPR) repeat protein